MSDHDDDGIPEEIPAFDDGFPEEFSPEEYSTSLDGIDLSDFDISTEAAPEEPPPGGMPEPGNPWEDPPETAALDGGPLEDPFASPEPLPAGAAPPPEDAPPGDLDTRQQQGPALKPYEGGDKLSPSDIIKSKPPALNKQLLLYIAGGILISSVLFVTVVAPLIDFDFEKPREVKKPVPAGFRPPDYSSMIRAAGGSPEEEAAPEAIEEPPPPLYDYDAILDGLPPVTQAGTPPAPVRGAGGGGTVSARPDTVNDPLQAKSIPGIKGITPTQQRYLGGQAVSGLYPPQASGDPANPYAQFGMPQKEDYANQLLSLYGQQSLSGYQQQNDQDGKTAFYNAGRENSGNGYWLSPYSIWQGTIFEAALTSDINTDLPGECTARIIKNVYSSQDGRSLLIPQGSILLGSYNSAISYSQRRVQVGWYTLIRPDGYYINLGNMQATDSRGASGLPGRINDHPWQYLKALLLLSALDITNSELLYTMGETNNQYVQNVLANSQNVMNTLGGKIIDRTMDIQPTITIKSGTVINIVANNNLVLPPIEPYPVQHPYHRGE
jgi:type IV secretion system protein VirB10